VAFDDPIGCDLDADELYWQEEMMEARKVVMRLFDKHFSEYWLDAILMADCIYSEASARALVTTLRAVVEENWRRFGDQRSVEIYCISELRNQAAQDEFLSFARQFGFEYRLIPPAVWNPVVPEECRMDYVNFYRLWFRGVND
jgi:hypothetical protein